MKAMIKCIAYLSDGNLCGSEATGYDPIRGGAICELHASDGCLFIGNEVVLPSQSELYAHEIEIDREEYAAQVAAGSRMKV